MDEDFFIDNLTWTGTEDDFGNDTVIPTSRIYVKRVDLQGEVRIPLYIIIFILSIMGNSLVIATLIQNKRMRTVTNVFLLNLSVSDLLLTVFCMPFTLIPVLLKDFIFGPTMCVMIRYLQGLSVGTSCFTLVAISLERYFAICRPLRSRSWQTLSHSYKTIAFCWILSAVLNIPTAVFTKLRAYGMGKHMCREEWADMTFYVAYMIILDIMLLALPLLIMSLSYGWIIKTLWKGMQMDVQIEKEAKNGMIRYSDNDTSTDDGYAMNAISDDSVHPRPTKPRKRFDYHKGMRQSNSKKSREAKTRVIKMLIAIVFEFFVCWTPSFVVQTWIVMDYMDVLKHVTPLTLSLIHLVTYLSTCCNPITYCFMNKKFRQGFFSAFRCCFVLCPKWAKSHEAYQSTQSVSARTMNSRATAYDKMQDSDEMTEKGI